MPGWAGAKIEPVILEAETAEKYGTGQAVIGRTKEIEMEGAGHLGMRDKKESFRDLQLE